MCARRFFRERPEAAMWLRSWRFLTLFLSALALMMTSAHVLELHHSPRSSCRS